MKNIIVFLIAGVLAVAGCRKDKSKLKDFQSEMDSAMSKMMTDMNAVPMTMDPDIDFAKMMIPHHRGAIEMADIILKYSSHAELADMATMTKTENQESISRLNQYIAAHGAPVPAADTGFTAKMHKAMEKMHHTMMGHHYTVDPDYDFASQMIHHHQGGIDMSHIELEFGVDSLIRGEARMLIDKQQEEIVKLGKFLHDHGEPEKIRKH